MSSGSDWLDDWHYSTESDYDSDAEHVDLMAMDSDTGGSSLESSLCSSPTERSRADSGERARLIKELESIIKWAKEPVKRTVNGARLRVDGARTRVAQTVDGARDQVKQRVVVARTKVAETVGGARDGVKQRVVGARSKVAQSFGGAKLTVKRNVDHVKIRIKRPRVIKLIDKLSFTGGVVNMAITEAVFLLRPNYFWLWYLIILFPLMVIRQYLYRKQKFHYFMYDFCYFVNFLAVLLAMGAFPAQYKVALFQVVFLLSNGPLLFAIIAWRNSLVFHSLDKMTSFFIHAFPSLLTYCMKWRLPSQQEDVCDNAECSLSIMRSVLLPLAVYLFWQAVYVLKTEVISRKKLDNDADIQTSLRWLTKDAAGAMYVITLRAARRMGIVKEGEKFCPSDWRTKFCFMAAQFVVSVCTIVPAQLLFHYEAVHLAWCVLCFVAVTYNGAAYYVEVFSRRYHKQFDASIDQPMPPAGSAEIEREDG